MAHAKAPGAAGIDPRRAAFSMARDVTDFSTRQDKMVFDIADNSGFGFRGSDGRGSNARMSLQYDHGDTVIDMLGNHIVLEHVRPGALDFDNFQMA